MMDARTQRLVRLYWRSLGARRRFERRLAIVSDGVWLGLLDPPALAQVDEDFYARFTEPLGDGEATYGDDAWNRQGLHSWESTAVERYFPRGGRVIVTGAGGGREVVALVELGFDAVGYEPNREFVERGSALLAGLGHPGRLRPMPRGTWPKEVKSCDAALVGWGSYMLIPGRENRVAFLRGARAALPSGAPILVSFFVRRHEQTAQAVARVANVVRSARRAAAVEVGDDLVPNFVHAFSEEEIADELGAAGFEVTDYQAKPYGHVVGIAD